MEGKLNEVIFYCKECGNLDYMIGGVCPKCGGKNITEASQDITFDNTAHDHLMKVIYAQHEQTFLGNQ